MPGEASDISAPLAPCVHCGFCLPACPTYLATGDENDSPRGRIVLMRRFAAGELPPGDAALNHHLDRCLGCRGCEPACPSGVAYGAGLQAARTHLGAERGLPVAARGILRIFASSILWRPLFIAARWLRDTGLPRRFSRASTALGMLASTSPRGAARPARTVAAGHGPTVVLFRGCVMDTLFGHVHDATRRTLEVNGYRLVEAQDQACCGALHEHAGDHAGAQALARRNVEALGEAADYIAVDSAGCGAALRDYGHLLGGDGAAALAAKVRDVTELLAAAGPRPGGPLPLEVAYDAPCHLQHAQRVHAAPLAVLGAIEGARVRELPGADRCCGSAGIYSLLEPGLSQAVLSAKLETIRSANPAPDVVATGNPGCLMQIGAGLLAAGIPTRTAHPVELLDEAYRASGYYDANPGGPR